MNGLQPGDTEYCKIVWPKVIKHLYSRSVLFFVFLKEVKVQKNSMVSKICVLVVVVFCFCFFQFLFEISDGDCLGQEEM